ncbi:MAG: hypothetical protein HY051_00740 [Candidatus Aenigmarchaeota archaeon]|nr:hypothetical protein [Candidatus Aenigmarchaeota archaeon]
MARPRTSTAVPSATELYPKSPLGWVYDHTIGSILNHKLASTLATAAVTGSIVAGSILSSGGSAREAVNANTGSQAGSSAVIQTSSSQPRETIVDIYYSQVRSALVQDVPELADPAYRSALDYTTQRMVDMKKVYRLSLEQVRVPIAKWVQFNVDIDKRGERLVAFTQDIDFIPDTLFRSNATFDLKTNNKTSGINPITKQFDSSLARTSSDRFVLNTNTIIKEHDQIWKQVNDPGWVDEQLDLLEGWSASSVAYEGIEASFPAYAKAIRTKGTHVDKKHWALYMKGRDDARFLESGEEIRKYAAQTRILAVGGVAQIEIWGFKPSDLIRRPDGTRVLAGHGDLAVYMSPELEEEFKKNPELYGTMLDRNGYLGTLPSMEGVAIQGTSKTQPEIAAMWLEVPVNQLGNGGRFYIYGNETVAKQYGH